MTPIYVADLRTLPQQAARDPRIPGPGLFYDGQFAIDGWALDPGDAEAQAQRKPATWRAPATFSAQRIYVGDDLLSTLNLTTRRAIEDRFALARDSLPQASFADILIDHLKGALADPAGITGLKPYRMTPRGMHIRLPVYGPIRRREGFSRNHLHYQMAMAVRRHDYQLLKQHRPLAELQRLNGWDLRKWRLTPNELQELLDAIDLDDGYLDPTTTFTDAFTVASDTDIASHTPTGGGFAWEYQAGTTNDYIVRATQDDLVNATGNPARARTDTGLSSADHHCQAKLTDSVDGGRYGRHAAVCVRCAAAADTCYAGGFDRASDVVGSYFIAKIVAGTITELAAVDGTDSPSNNTCQLVVIDDDLELLAVDGATSVLTVTNDTSITGGTQVGLSSDHTGVSRVSFDDFTSTEESAAAAARRVMVMS